MASPTLHDDPPPCAEAGNAFAALGRFAAHLTPTLDAFATPPADLSPYDIELTRIHILTGAIRTAAHLVDLRQQTADAADSAAFAPAIAQLEAMLARAEASLDALEAQRNLEAIPWRQRLRLQSRYQTALERLYLTQARLRHQGEVRAARRQQRAQQAQQREVTRRTGMSRQMVEYLRGGRATLPAADERQLAPETAEATAHLSLPVAAGAPPAGAPPAPAASPPLPGKADRRPRKAGKAKKAARPHSGKQKKR
jgi:hypothetical protein